MFIFILLFGLLSGCLLSICVGMIGSSRRLGFGWAFIISLIFTPVVGLIVALISDPLPDGEKRWGCIGTVIGILGLLCLITFLGLLFGCGTLLML